MLTAPLYDVGQIKNMDQLYAHTKKDSQEKELLVDHFNKTIHYFKFLYKEKQLESIFEKQAHFFFKDDELAQSIWKELFVNAIYLHDIGKLNGNFQKVKMGNVQAFHVKKSGDTNHSMLSAVIYYSHYFKHVAAMTNSKSKKKLLMFLILNSYAIAKHHSHFDSLEVFFEKFTHFFELCNEVVFFDNLELDFSTVLKSSAKILKGIQKEISENGIDSYIYVRFLYSCLCTADFYATGDFMRSCQIDEIGTIKNIEKYRTLYESGEIYQSIERYRKNIYPQDYLGDVGDINVLRTELFLEAEKSLKQYTEQNIYYLEAPTGGGKTNISIHLALTLLETNPKLNKILYVFPFNTLIEQTYQTLLKHFSLPDEIAVLNSVTPMLDRKEKNTEESENLQTDFEQTLLDRQFLHYPIVLTSHVNLFSYFFGVNKESIFALVHLANSVIILDEIQSYRNLIWKEIIQFLKQYAEILNIKIIIMSATMPELGKLIDLEVPSLISDRERFFQHPLFKKRVNFDFSLLNEENFSLESLCDIVGNVFKERGGKFLIEFITKKSATQFFMMLKNAMPSYDIELLTGDDHKLERERIIKKATKQEEIILIATQVVEAGVDIDMDIGFKNISILDAEEQFAGRINRSCKKAGSTIYFFEIDKVHAIYKGDLRVNQLQDFSVRNPLYQEVLEDKNFVKFYESVFLQIEKVTSRLNKLNYENFMSENIPSLNFINIEARMRLIEKKEYEITVFLNRQIEVAEGEFINGTEVWEQYKQLIYDKRLSFAERKVRLAKHNEKMNYFLYRINQIVDYEDQIGHIFYIEDGEKYFSNEKFDREAFNVQSFI